jgi:MFS family permease
MKPTTVIVASLFTVYMGLGLLNPLLAPLVRELGLSETQGGLIITMAALAFALGSPLWGRRSEQWGRKPVLLLGLAGFAVGFGLFAFGAQLGMAGVFAPTAAFVALALARGLAGFLMGSVPVAAQAFIADTTSGADRTAGLALLGAANGLGMIAGPALGVVLAGMGLLAPLYIVAFLPVIAVVLVVRFLPATAPRVRYTAPPALRPTDARIRPWLLIGLTIVIALVGAQITTGFLIQDRLNLSATETVRTLGFALVAVGVTNLIAQLGIVRRFKVPPLTLLRIGLPLAALGFAVLVGTNSPALLVLAFMLAGLGLGLALPGYTAAVTLEVTPAEQGAVAGLTTATQGFGAVLAPILGAGLYQLRPDYPFLLGGILLTLLALAIWLHPRLRRISAPAQSPVPQA